MLARAAIYLDANAGAPLSSAAIEALLPFLHPAWLTAKGEVPGTVTSSGVASLGPVLFPNPSSSHELGRQARRSMTLARQQIAHSLGPNVIPEDLLLTSSGTEAGQTAIRATLEGLQIQGKKPHWILSEVEHDAHLQLVAWLKVRGGSVSFLPTSPNGLPQTEALASLWRPETALVSVIWVNNETGVITDIEALARQANARGVPLHLDGAQAWGKIPVDLNQTGASWVSFSGHKIGGLAGTGILWNRSSSLSSLKGSPLIFGSQEMGRRGGTENLLGAVALGAAAAKLAPEAWAEQVTPLRDRLEKEIQAKIPGTRIHGQGALRVGNTLNLGFDGIDKAGLVMALDLEGFCVSSGSACSSGIAGPSHVLKAMGQGDGEARSAIRISLSEQNQWPELERFVPALARAVERLRTAKWG